MSEVICSSREVSLPALQKLKNTLMWKCHIQNHIAKKTFKYMLGLYMIINAVHELSVTRDLPHMLVLLLFWFMFVISRAVTYFRINRAFLKVYPGQN